MKLVQAILTQNPCYTAGRKITVKGLMLHSVGCPQPKASVFINSWNSASFDRACVHAFIDANDGTVYQTLPWNHRGWHGGGPLTTPTLVWKCANPPVSSIRAARLLPALILPQLKPVRKGLMKRR